MLAFDPSMEGDAERTVRFRNELALALAEGQFELYFQPQLNLQNGEHLGCEALIRWRHPERGLILPGEFIPLAERLGLIAGIDTWVMHAALRAAHEFERRGQPMRVYFNLSGRHAGDPKVIEALKEAAADGLSLRNLGIEITETDAMRDFEATRTVCVAARELGVRVALDDFGTGYSSLTALRRLPVDLVKIDRSFVAGILENRQDAALVETIIQMARIFGCDVLAEGVEQDGEIDWLRDRECTFEQGYAIARAAPDRRVQRLAEGRDVAVQQRRHVPIQPYLTGLFALITLVIGLSTAGLFYDRMKTASLNEANVNFDRISTNIAQQLLQVRLEVQYQLAMVAGSRLARARTFAERTAAKDDLIPLLNANSLIDQAFVGFPNGDFIRFSRVLAADKPPASAHGSAVYTMQTVQISDGRSVGHYWFYNKNRKLLTVVRRPIDIRSTNAPLVSDVGCHGHGYGTIHRYINAQPRLHRLATVSFRGGLRRRRRLIDDAGSVEQVSPESLRRRRRRTRCLRSRVCAFRPHDDRPRERASHDSRNDFRAGIPAARSRIQRCAATVDGNERLIP